MTDAVIQESRLARLLWKLAPNFPCGTLTLPEVVMYCRDTWLPRLLLKLARLRQKIAYASHGMRKHRRDCGCNGCLHAQVQRQLRLPKLREELAALELQYNSIFQQWQKAEAAGMQLLSEKAAAAALKEVSLQKDHLVSLVGKVEGLETSFKASRGMGKHRPSCACNGCFHAGEQRQLHLLKLKRQQAGVLKQISSNLEKCRHLMAAIRGDE